MRKLCKNLMEDPEKCAENRERISGVFRALSSVVNETLGVGELLQIDTLAYTVSKEGEGGGGREELHVQYRRSK